MTDLPAFWYVNYLNDKTVTQINQNGVLVNRWADLKWSELCVFGLRHPKGYIAIDRVAGRIQEDGATRSTHKNLHLLACGEPRYRRRHLFDNSTGLCQNWYTEIAMGSIAIAVLHTEDTPRTLFTHFYDPEKGLEQYRS